MPPFPHKFTGFQVLNPLDPQAGRATADIAARGLRGLLLFPAMHRFYPDDPDCLETCRLARQYGLVVFVHVGPLRIVIQEKLGGGGTIQPSYGDPRRLGNALRAFPEVPFIVPHFGSGRLAALLEAARETRNLYLDTSSSNSWMRQGAEPTDLETVFGTMLEEKAFGPERLLFGSDSTVFPRGWRKDIYWAQRAALDRLGGLVARETAHFFRQPGTPAAPCRRRHPVNGLTRGGGRSTILRSAKEGDHHERTGSGSPRIS